MTMAELVEALNARGSAAARRATTRGQAAIIAAAAALPGVEAVATADGVELTAPGLRRRARGTRQAAADPRLLGLVDTVRETRR